MHVIAAIETMIDSRFAGLTGMKDMKAVGKIVKHVVIVLRQKCTFIMAQMSTTLNG
jgi:hypothetical protein